jgi:peptidoglycan/xylan/chitin deacetylase (PgdA/CDA1 family)
MPDTSLAGSGMTRFRQKRPWSRMKLSIASATLLYAWCSFLAAAHGGDRAGSRGAECWKPAELRGTLEDWRATKGTPAAFRRPPSRALLPFAPIDPRLRGVIRSVRLPANEKIVALTFDLCEEPYEVSGYDSRIIDYLRDEGVEATFFAGGKWLLTHNVRAQQLLSDPLFEVGNHSWEHRNLRIVSEPVLKSEIENAQAAYEEVRQNFEGRLCKPRAAEESTVSLPPERMSLFRFPFGACDERSLKAVNDAGLLAIQWTVSSGDPAPLQTSERIVKGVMSRVRPGAILIFHANGRGWHTAEALREIIPRLKEAGYKFRKVSELLKLAPDKIEKVATCYDSKPGDSDHYDALAAKLELQYNKFEKQIKAQPGG